MQNQEEHRIIVEVAGGMVTAVLDIPAGVVVEVRDFDTEGGDCDEDGNPLDADLFGDEWAYVSEYDADGAA